MAENRQKLVPGKKASVEPFKQILKSRQILIVQIADHDDNALCSRHNHNLLAHRQITLLKLLKVSLRGESDNCYDFLVCHANRWAYLDTQALILTPLQIKD